MRHRAPVLAERALWGLLVVLALVPRGATIPASLPYLGYVDEGHVLHPVIALMRGGGLDPGTYLHPPLTVYLIAGLANVYRPLYRIAHGKGLRGDLPADEAYYDLVQPPELITIGRVLIALLSVGTVLLAGLLARRYGGPPAGLLAGLFAAACPALVSRGSIVIVDTTAAFLAILALCVVTSGERVTARTAFLAGLVSGLALAAKYTVGAVFAGVLAIIAARTGSRASKVRAGGWALAGLLAGTALGIPPLLWKPGDVVRGLLEQSRLYLDPSLFDPRNTDTSYLAQLLAPGEVGAALLAAACAGALLMLARPATRPAALGALAFGAVLVLPLALHSYRPFRQLLSLVPLLCVGAAIAVAWLLRAPRARWLGAAAALAVAASLAVPADGYVRARLALVDSRRNLVDWLSARVRAGERVLLAEEAAVLPGELARVPGAVRVAPLAEVPTALASSRYTYLVACRLDLFGSRDPGLTAARERWDAFLAGRSPVAAFGGMATPVHPNYWRYNGELLEVYRLDGRHPPRGGAARPGAPGGAPGAS